METRKWRKQHWEAQPYRYRDDDESKRTTPPSHFSISILFFRFSSFNLFFCLCLCLCLFFVFVLFLPPLSSQKYFWDSCHPILWTICFNENFCLSLSDWPPHQIQNWKLSCFFFYWKQSHNLRRENKSIIFQSFTFFLPHKTQSPT